MNSNHKVEIVVGVRDLASQSLNNVSKSVNNLKHNMGNGSFLSSFNRNLDQTISKMDKLANSMYKFNMYTNSIQRGIRNVGLVGAAGAGVVAYQGVNQSLDFDYNTRKMQSRMGVNNDTRKQINDYILNTLNQKTSFSANELALTGITLAQGGISSSADMKSLLKTTSYFAEAVDAIPDQAAEMIISAAKGWNISMDKSMQISDKLSVALNASLLHVEELPHAIGELAGRATMYGQSFDSSLVALMTARDQGMSAAQASQDFLHGLRQLSKIGREDLMPPKTLKAYKKLGIDTSFFDLEKKQLKEYPEIIASIEKTMVNKGLMKPGEISDIVQKNGGVLPEDFINKMSAMPLISKVFGAAGMAPILMGLQSKYEEVDKDGNKTGEVLYGSAALRRRRELVANSGGTTENTHDIIAESGKFQLDVLKGNWESLQIGFWDKTIPMIKGGSQFLSAYLNGTLDKDNRSLKDRQIYPEDKRTVKDDLKDAITETANNFRANGNVGTANFIQGAGTFGMNSFDVGSAVAPGLLEQIGKSINDSLLKADWGDSLITLPYHIIENGVSFITDLAKANEDINAAIEKLPENLQDPARLVEKLVKGGLILLVGGAIVKTLELSFRAASATLKTAKGGINIAGSLVKALRGDTDGAKDTLKKLANSNKVINANIVNVYGKAINNMGDGVDVSDGSMLDKDGNLKQKRTDKFKKSKKLQKLLEGGSMFIAPLIGADIISAQTGGPSVLKAPFDMYNKHKQEKIEYWQNIYSGKTSGNIPKQTELAPIVNRINTVDERIKNMKVNVNNKVQITNKVPTPIVTISGNLKNVGISHSISERYKTDKKFREGYNRIQAQRLGLDR